MSQQTQTPTTITLNAQNSVEILSSYVESAQSKGAFLLAESDILKRCRDVLLRGLVDKEINVPSARNLFIQAVNKGQSKGCYTLDDASILHNVCQYVSQNLSAEAPPVQQQVQPQQVQPQQVQPQQVQQVQQVEDLSSLSDPVPLRMGPRTV